MAVKKKTNKNKVKPQLEKNIKETEVTVADENPGLFQGFFDFLKKYSVIGLAIGLVIGNSSQNLVKIIVEGLITPALNLVLGFMHIQSLKDYAPGGFKIGLVLQSGIEFVIILFLVYFIIKRLLKRDDLIEKK